MKKNEKDMNMKEKMNDIFEVCRNCPENQDCAFAYKSIPGFTHSECPVPNACEEDHSTEQEDDACGRASDELLELDAAVDELVDSLFNVVEKAAEVRLYLKQLDDLTDAALDYLSAIGVPQLCQED